MAFLRKSRIHESQEIETNPRTRMPTFLVLKGSKVTETIRGANPTALRSAVLSAAADAAKGPAKQSAAFSGSGQKLGGESSGRPLGGGSGPAMPAIPNVAEMLTAPGQFAQGRGIPAMIVRFLGLYISTLFSFDPMKTAEESPFAVKKANFNKAR